MAATKTCPSCDADVPASANRCKDCFHDFNEVAKRPNGGPIVLLFAFAAMAVIGAVTFFIALQQPIEAPRILVDEETRSIVYITTYRSGPTTKRVAWDDIATLENVTSSSGHHEIVAVTLDGERHVIKTSKAAPLTGDAHHYQQVMDKPLLTVDNTRGFHKSAEKNAPTGQ